MTINVSKDVKSSINAAVQSGRFASADEMIAKLVREYDQRTQQRTAAAPPHKPIWEEFEEIAASIPDEEWAKLPVDGAERHDHYIGLEAPP